MLSNQFKQLGQEDDVLFLEDKIFNAVQIVNRVLQYFEPKGNDLNLSCKDKFMKKYFKKKNVQGIFNRVEWQFYLRPGIQCELVMPDKSSRQKGKLEIRVTLEFSSLNRQVVSMNNGENISESLSITESKSSENFDIKVSLDFYPDERFLEETHEENSWHFYSSNSAVFN
ncbi:MAG: KGK domain-containing protein [Brasilonema sp.]